jgi:glycine betaine/proline transport system substrate-binding protein
VLLLTGNVFAQKDVIKFSDQQWQTHWINNAIAMFIVEHGYGYPVETVVTTTPVMKQVFPEGDIDVNMELWRANSVEWYQEITSSGKVLDLGPTFEKSTQGWYVPRFVIEGDPDRGIEPLAPDLKSVFDLPKYKELFKDPEDPDKGLLISCITGWTCAKINAAKFYAYNLDETYNILEPGTSPALDASIAGAYKKGDPVLAYYWEPTWLMGAYDMVQLEEPEFTEECDNLMKEIVAKDLDPQDTPKEAACAYKEYAIHKAAHHSLQDRAPEVVEFLKKMNVGTDPLNKTSAYMEENDAEAEDAALWFFQNYQERWRSWLPEDVTAKVEQALADAGVTLE